MKHEYYMRLALEEARQAMLENEVPVGAVLVKDNRILAKTHNKKEVLQDATAHAEILAIREGGRLLQNWRLDDCVLYVTLEPCFMCASAILQSRIKTLVYGARDVKQGAIESRINSFEHSQLETSEKIAPSLLPVLR